MCVVVGPGKVTYLQCLLWAWPLLWLQCQALVQQLLHRLRQAAGNGWAAFEHTNMHADLVVAEMRKWWAARGHVDH
jgi:hypothetical protein